jgi:(p)ppGpp synthase/HD superfamily hydrolase
MTKEELALRLETLFIDKNFVQSLKALESVMKITTTRKDGITPSVVHQLSVTNYLLSFEKVITNDNPELLLMLDTLCAIALLHDSLEDNHITEEDLVKNYAEMVCTAVKQLSKTNKSKQNYFDQILKIAYAVVVKGVDRIHNCQTMVGVFTPEKQAEYIEETNNYVIPLLRKARYKYPKLDPIFVNEILILESQIELITKLSKAAEPKIVEARITD